MKTENRKNIFFANDWFDINFLAKFIHSDSKIKKKFNEKNNTIGDERLSSRVLNHWYDTGIINDDRPNGKGWKKFSFSEMIWISIVYKLRGFGLDLKRIKQVKDQIDKYNSPENISKCPLLDFYMCVAMSTNTPVKLIVFESGQADIVRQIDIDVANEIGGITEDFILIDINKLMNRAFAHKEIKADYLSYNKVPKSGLIEQIENSISTEDIQSITIKVKNEDYIIDESFIIKDRTKANALMSLLKFGELVEKKNRGKSTFKVTNKKKINK